ncbi:MAG: hypothetical protein KGH64_01255, partial [Candidatus Micrarchaeota archaeon]|nr:hypothetical protein [Candidatus Micrarchaeota archaeon]
MNLPRISLSLRNPIIRIVATFLIIATVALILLIYYIHNAVAEIPKANNTTVVLTGPISGKVSLVAKGALQYSNSKYIMEFARLHYAINNVANITATLNVYKSNPLPKIYLLNVQGYCPSGACLIGPITYASLNASLSKYGLILNKSSLNGVDISNIGLIPPGSIIIIPSGLMPLALLPNVTTATQKYGCNINSSASLLTLLSQGDTILYVGRNLTSAVTCSGQVIQTPYESALAIWGLVNDTQPAPQVNGTNSTGPLYLQNASFSYRDNLTFGTATGMQFLNGSFLVLPNYPSTGWADNYTFLASDIAKTLASRFWIPILAQGNISLNGSGTAYSSSYLTLFTTNSIILNSPTISSLVNSTYPLVVLTAKNNDTSKTFDVPVSINYQYKGTLSMPSVVGLGQSTQLAAEAYGTQSAVFAVAKIMDSNLTAYSNLSISFGRLGPTPVIQSFNRVSVPPGYYIANLTSTDGKSTYASTLFYVAPANITPAILGFENDTFVFSALSNGQQMDGIPYSININGAYNSTGTTNYGNIDYTLPQGTIIPYGNESFNIAMLGYHYNIP